jgi:capsular polysaccharide biosynthesis protein
VIKLLKKCLLNPIINSARPDFCEHILDRALLEKWPVKKIHESFTLDLPMPNEFADDENVRISFEGQQHLKFPTQHLACIPNASILGGFVRLPSGEFLTESDWRMKYFLESNISRSRYHRHKSYIDGDCYYLDILFSANYGHWLADEIPRLVSALPFLPPTTQFIVIDPIQQYKSESLAALGVTAGRIVPVKGYYQIRCERLWYATPANDMIWNLKVLSQVKNTLLRAYGGTSGPTPEKIFISRSSAASKRLINEDQLLPLIEEFGLSVVRAEKLSLAQQVRTFSKAKVVLAAHGSGMTNMLFSPPPALLLELQDSRFAPRLWYWKWASMLGHKYCSMTGPVVESNGWLDTNFSIKPDSLKQYLESSLLSADGKPKVQWWVSQ